MFTITGYCITYGSCISHPDVLPGAFNNCNGARVPVKMDAYRWGAIGYADLTVDDKGVIAKITLFDMEFIVDYISQHEYRLSCMANQLKKDKNNNVFYGVIRYVKLDSFGLGDKVRVEKIKEENI